jgi:hypothetical protein
MILYSMPYRQTRLPALHSSGRVLGFDAVAVLAILCHVIYRHSGPALQLRKAPRVTRQLLAAHSQPSRSPNSALRVL